MDKGVKLGVLIGIVVTVIVVVIVTIASIFIITRFPSKDGNGVLDTDGDGYNDDVDDYPNDPEHHEIVRVVDYEDVHVYDSGTSYCADFSFPEGWCRDFEVPSGVDHIIWNWISEEGLDFKVHKVDYPNLRTVYSQSRSIGDWDSCNPQEFGRYIVSWTIPEIPGYEEIIIDYVYVDLID